MSSYLYFVCPYLHYNCSITIISTVPTCVTSAHLYDVCLSLLCLATSAMYLPPCVMSVGGGCACLSSSLLPVRQLCPWHAHCLLFNSTCRHLYSACHHPCCILYKSACRHTCFLFLPFCRPPSFLPVCSEVLPAAITTTFVLILRSYCWKCSAGSDIVTILKKLYKTHVKHKFLLLVKVTKECNELLAICCLFWATVTAIQHIKNALLVHTKIN